MTKFSRRSFLKSAGVATGAAVIAGVPGVAAAATEGAAEVVGSPLPLPREPLVAYVRDAERFEITIVSGKQETTYRDKALVKKLLKATSHHRRAHRPGEVA